MSLSMTLGGSMPSTLPSLTVGTLEVTGAATFAATVTATGQFLAGNGSAAAPSYSFQNSTGTGLYQAGNALRFSSAGTQFMLGTANDIQPLKPVISAAGGNGTQGFYVGGSVANGVYSPNGTQMYLVGASSAVGQVSGSGIGIDSSYALFWGALGTGAGDLYLVRDAANVLAQRNSTNEQMFRLYGTYTSATNYERVDFGCTTSSYNLATAKGAAGGTLRSLGLYGAPLYLGTPSGNGGVASSTTRWEVSTAGHFLAFATNTYDIGAAAGVTCPRTIYAATSVSAPDFTNGGTISFSPAGVSKWAIDAAGVFYCVVDNVNDIGASGNYRPRNVYIANDVFIGNAIQAPAYRDAGANQVVGARGAAVADATGAGDVVAQLNTLLARCRAHGLIAT